MITLLPSLNIPFDYSLKPTRNFSSQGCAGSCGSVTHLNFFRPRWYGQLHHSLVLHAEESHHPPSLLPFFGSASLHDADLRFPSRPISFFFFRRIPHWRVALLCAQVGFPFPVSSRTMCALAPPLFFLSVPRATVVRGFFFSDFFLPTLSPFFDAVRSLSPHVWQGGKITFFGRRRLLCFQLPAHTRSAGCILPHGDPAEPASRESTKSLR